MAAFFKAILAMQRQIKLGVKGFKSQNPYIETQNTPFYVTAEHETWEQRKNDMGQVLPRRAGINSFGFGGVNAHVIIEEYVEREDIEGRRQSRSREAGDTGAANLEDRGPHLIVLSGKNEERLKEVARNLHNFIIHHSSLILPDLAYTLQVGREAMEERLAFAISSKNDLLKKLELFLNHLDRDELSEHSIYIGSFEQIKRNRLTSIIKREFTDGWFENKIQKGELEDIGALWVEGIPIPWESLHKGEKVRKIRLPTYPFERQRYWVSGNDVANPVPVLEDEDEIQFTLDPGQSERANMAAYLTQLVSQLTKIPVAEIKPNKTFYDSGLDSLTGRQLFLHIEERFAVKLSGEKLLQYNCIDALSEYLTPLIAAESLSAMAPDQTLQTEPQPLTPLSEGQKGLWLLQQLSPEMSAYNVPIALRFRQVLSVDKLKQACEFLLNQHPILKTLIEEQDGIPIQRIDYQQPLYFEQQTLDAALKDEAIIKRLTKLVKQPFDLQTGPLMRVHLLSLGDQQQILLITIHHIICDGSSILPLITTLLDIYQDLIQNKIPHLISNSTDYADFVQWEKDLLNSEEDKTHRAYWSSQLSGELPVLTTSD